MSGTPDWLPPIMPLSQFDGDWDRYIEAVYAAFRQDLIDRRPKLMGKPISCQLHPMHDEKEATFWHCISEGADEAARIPDLRRCERIPWIRAVIEHSSDPRVRAWSLPKKHDVRLYLWLDEEYLIVLGVRKGYFQLITSFRTDYEHTKRKLRAEIARARKS